MSVRSCTPSCVFRGRWLVVSGAALALAASLSLAAPAAAQGPAAKGRGALPVLAGAPTASLASSDQALTEVTIGDAGFQPDEVTISVGRARPLVRDLLRLFPNRTEASVRCQLRRLGLPCISEAQGPDMAFFESYPTPKRG